MAKKKCAPKTKAEPKGLAGAAMRGGEPIDVNVGRLSVKLPLRDLFAAFAMAGMLADASVRDTQGVVAKNAWLMADAMLKARG